jgi:7,8-dihydropterin-6-yl-methyl-4-(beta-D-ribofuranosyl)aminobenzene 5'-phosphate synthase
MTSLPQGMTQLDELEVLVVIDNETDTLSSVDEGVPQIPEVVDLAARTPSSRTYEGHECKAVFDRLCCACHGLSVLVTGHREGQQRSMLFDVGPYPDLWLANARRLGVDLSTIECVFLSHWHFDHSGGFPRSSPPFTRRARPRISPGRSSICIRIGRTSAAFCCRTA